MNIKRVLCAALAAVFCAATVSGCGGSTSSGGSGGAGGSSAQSGASGSDTSEGEAVAAVNDTIDTAISPLDFTAKIKVGWSLGNTLEATGGSGLTSEVSWGNPYTTEQLILGVKEAGFNAIRVPVTWFNHMDDNHNIDPEWMARVVEVVNYVYNNDMYVILNVHHEDWNYPYDDNFDAASAIMKAVWTQIAEQFKGYDERLIFEGQNEPRWVGTNEEWSGGNEEGWRNVNKLNQVFVDTVRATGGNNASRFLMVPDYAASSSEQPIRAFEIPNDPAKRVIVAVHAYTPYSFALQGGKGQPKWVAEKDACTRDIDWLASLLNELFISKGVAVIMGETGCVGRWMESEETYNTEYRVAWAEYYFRAFKKVGIPVFWFDNGAFISGETLGLFDRGLAKPRYPEIVDAIMKGVTTD